jgi:C1A family cysteine protease
MSTTALLVLAAAGMASAALPALTQENEQFLFTKWVQQYDKQYKTEEFFSKFGNFKQNLAKIMEHNASKKGYTMAMNEYGDMTADEFKAMYTGYKGASNAFLKSMNAPDNTNAPAAASAVDWRTKGAVTPVKNQGQCGSCWAFSTTGSLEGAHFLAGNSLTAFSEQQLVDCAAAEGNQGCNGGLMDQGFEYIIKQGSLCKEADYPYTAATDSCNVCSSPVAKLVSSYKDVTSGDESALMTAVNLTPVSIAIEADQSAFQFYSGGVMDGTCGTALDHGVLLVGYGTDSGKDYWTVKNSWGASWGESGYIRLIRGQNQCGLANAASYPVV